MTDEATPISEKHEHPFHKENGLEQCPVCGKELCARFYTGQVVKPRGLMQAPVYDTLYDTAPGDGPYYCIDCWREHLVQARGEANHQLSDYTEYEITYEK